MGDLFPHLLDLVDYFFNFKNLKFKSLIDKNKSLLCNKFENKSTDHAILQTKINNIFLQIEASYCAWKNQFYCEVVGDKGSLHLNSLSTWGRVVLNKRKRVFPSGIPIERMLSEKKKDITWKAEHSFFSNLILKRKKNNLSKEFWINKNLLKLKEIVN